jgi:hypothetical protein
MQTFFLVVMWVYACISFLSKWALGWAYIFSPSARHELSEHLGARSRFWRFHAVLWLVFGFLIVNVLIGAILWRVFVGPIKPIHEW